MSNLCRDEFFYLEPLQNLANLYTESCIPEMFFCGKNNKEVSGNSICMLKYFTIRGRDVFR